MQHRIKLAFRYGIAQMPPKTSSDFGNDAQRQTGFLANLRKSWQRFNRQRSLVKQEKRALKDLELERRQKMAAAIKAKSQVESSSTVAPPPAQAGPEESKGMLYVNQNRVEEKPKGIWSRIQSDREVRRKIIAERKAMNEALNSSVKKPANRTQKSEFGVGTNADYATDKPKSQVIDKKKILARITAKVFELRIPQWALATLPVILFFAYAIIPSVTEYKDRGVRTTRSYQAQLPELIKRASYTEAELVCRRAIAENVATMDNLFSYFDILTQQDKKSQAWNLLVAQEGMQNANELGQFELRFAEKILNTGELPRGAFNLAMFKLIESLKTKLPEADETKARLYLSRLFLASGKIADAYRTLEPIQARSDQIASEVLFLKINMGDANLSLDDQSKARRLLDSFDRKLADTKNQSEEDLGAQIRLLTLLGREDEARQKVAQLPNRDPKELFKWTRMINEVLLAREVRKKEIDEVSIWSKLEPLIKGDPDNQPCINIATTLWATTKDEKKSAAFEWVQARLNSGQASLPFLEAASMAAHVNSKWDLARPVYEKILKIEPDHIVALNNMASVLYKYPPYQLDRALAMIDHGLTLKPNMIALMETKGQILARLGRYNEAKPLLETTLAVEPNDWNIHNTLAQIYDQEGLKNQAQAHRDRLAKLQKPANAPLENSIRLVK